MARKKRLDVNEVLDRERAGFGLQEEQNIYHTAGYIRLSIEDSGKTDGYSLANQEKLVRDFIADQQDMRLYRLYIDNGATGTVFERPAFDEMMQDMKDGKINCIVVKDLSRLGRNYLEAGNYLEQIFPFFRVRFISITDGYDSNSPDVTDESLIIPLKNIINEGYAKDISLKITTSFELAQKAGTVYGTLSGVRIPERSGKQKSSDCQSGNLRHCEADFSDAGFRHGAGSNRQPAE